MAGSSFTDFLFQGQTPPAVTTDSTTTGGLPLWYSSYLSTLANQAAGVASNPYQTYDNARIAPQDPQETQAHDYLGANATNWQAPLQQAQGAAGNVAGGFNDEQFQKYLSPYTNGVVNEIGRLGMQNLNENLLPTLDNDFVGNGQFASDRNRTMDERLVRDTGANISGQQGMALQGAYTSAMGNYNTGQQNVNAAASNLGGLARDDQGLTTGTAGALSASGATQRGYDQSNYDLAYQDFQNQLNYPRQNVSFLSSVLRGTQVPTSQEQTSTAPFSGQMGPSPIATMGGLALAGLGVAKNQPTVPARTGGYVRNLRRGGRVGGLTLASRMPSRMALPAPRGGLEMMAS